MEKLSSRISLLPCFSCDSLCRGTLALPLPPPHVPEMFDCRPKSLSSASSTSWQTESSSFHRSIQSAAVTAAVAVAAFTLPRLVPRPPHERGAPPSVSQFQVGPLDVRIYVVAKSARPTSRTPLGGEDENGTRYRDSASNHDRDWISVTSVELLARIDTDQNYIPQEQNRDVQYELN